MNNKAQELELRTILQGLEEFATFMSFRSSTSDLRVLSVETVEQDNQRRRAQPKADVLEMKSRLHSQQDSPQQSVNKSLSFSDRKFH